MSNSSTADKTKLSDEDANKLLMSLDQRVLNQIILLQQQHQRSDNNDDRDEVISSVSGYFTQNNSNSSNVLGAPDDEAKLSRSPSLRKVSVGTIETKSGVFNKKKSIPSLVLTFNAANKFVQNTQDAVKKDFDDAETISSAARTQSVSGAGAGRDGSKQLLSVDSLMDKMETASVASYR